MAGFDVIDKLSELLIGGVLLLGLLYLMRRVMLWYWKLDQIEKHLAEIAGAMKRGSVPRSGAA